jgi:Caspase domain
MLDFFSNFSGFDLAQLRTCANKTARAIGLFSLLEVSGILLCVVSMYFAVQFYTQAWYWSGLAAIMILAILFALHGLTSSTYGLALNKDISSLDAWKPSKWRLGMFLLVALIFSQPIALYLVNSSSSKLNEISNAIVAQKNLQKEFLEGSIKDDEDLLNLEIARRDELLSQMKLQSQTGKDGMSQFQKTSNVVGIDPRRKALVIGNQAYPSSPLSNPIKDAKDLYEHLKGIGFSVTLLTNATRSTMEKSLSEYISTLKPGDISLLYFSGHGFQDQGNNYLVPVDFANLIDSKAVGLNIMIEALSSKSLLANVVIIDACRVFSMGSSGGLATTEAGVNTYLAFAANPGHTAADGVPNTNGLFTGAILKYIDKRIDIDTLFRSVRKDVAEKTANQQITASWNTLSDRLILASPEAIKAGDKTQGSKLGAFEYGNKPNSLQSSCETLATKMGQSSDLPFIKHCTDARIASLRDDLKQRTLLTKEKIDHIDEEVVKEKENPHLVPVKVLDAFLLYPGRWFIWTLLTMSLLSIGFVLRFFITQSQKEYEKAIYNDTNASVSKAINDMELLVKQFPHKLMVCVLRISKLIANMGISLFWHQAEMNFLLALKAAQ